MMASVARSAYNSAHGRVFEPVRHEVAPACVIVGKECEPLF